MAEERREGTAPSGSVVEEREERTGPRAGISVGGSLIGWGAVIAGFFVTIVTLVILTVLGLAIGLSAFEPGEEGVLGADTAATIWGIATAVIAFFLGGLVAARAAVAPTAGAPGAGGAFHGLMVGVTAIVAMIFMAGIGAGNVLGAAASNLRAITEVVAAFDVEGEEAARIAEAAFADAETGVWGTFITLLVAPAVAALGGLIGGGRRY